MGFKIKYVKEIKLKGRYETWKKNTQRQSYLFPLFSKSSGFIQKTQRSLRKGVNYYFTELNLTREHPPKNAFQARGVPPPLIMDLS